MLLYKWHLDAKDASEKQRKTWFFIFTIFSDYKKSGLRKSKHSQVQKVSSK